MKVTVITDENGNAVRNEAGLTLVQDVASGHVFYLNVSTPKVSSENKEKNDVENTNDEPEPQDLSPEGSPQQITNEEDLWSDKATRLFIETCIGMKNKFRDRNFKRKALWKEISETMISAGYAFKEVAVERKYRNLKAHYTNIKDNNTKTGRGRQTWQYFNVMEDLFRDDVCVNPISCVSSLPKAEIKSAQALVSLNTSKVQSGCSISTNKCSKVSATVSSESAANVKVGNLPSGYQMVKEIYPDSEMLPEDAAPQRVSEATAKRRLSATPKTALVKRVHKAEPEWAKSLKDIQAKHEEDVRGLKSAIEESNKIQNKRNDLLEKLLNKR